jgi:hypothetical protein
MKLKLPPKCARCIPGHRTKVWTHEGLLIQVSCAICRHYMSEQDQMRPRMALVAKAEAKEPSKV